MKYWLCLLVLFLLCLEHFLLWKKGNTSKCTFLPSYTLIFYWKLPSDKIKSPLKVWAFSLFVIIIFCNIFGMKLYYDCILPLSLVLSLSTHGMNHNIEGFCFFYILNFLKPFCWIFYFTALKGCLCLQKLQRKFAN